MRSTQMASDLISCLIIIKIDYFNGIPLWSLSLGLCLERLEQKLPNYNGGSFNWLGMCTWTVA